jgi:VWFA-related protein
VDNLLRGFVLVLSMAAVGVVIGQTPDAPQYTEEIEVRVIDIDVVVTDRQGKRLTHLTREDFELYENGQRVDIDYFSRITGGRIDDPPLSDDEAASLPPVAQQRTPLTWVIFIDHTNLTPQARNHAMRQLKVFAERAITRGDRGVIALNDGRSFRIRQGVTDDPKLLMETLTKMQKERMPVSPTRSRTNNLVNQMRRSEQDMAVPAMGGIGVARDETVFMAQTTGNEIATLIDEEASRTKAAILAMSALLDALAQVEGRLALVYVGAGFNSLPAADLAAMWHSRYADAVQANDHLSVIAPRPEEAREPIEREITRLYANLSTLRVTVYSIHGGDAGGGPTSVEDPGQLNVTVANSTDIGQLAEAGYVRELAQRTGGLYFKLNPRLGDQLDVVIRDLDDYYSLGFRPAGKQSDTRRIRVKVNVDGARVRHRETVRERTGGEKASGAVVASVVQPPRTAQVVSNREPAIPASVATAANPLGVSIEAEIPKRLDWEDDLLTFDFSINLDALTFARRTQGYRADFVMHFALAGEDGSVYPLESREQALTLPESELPEPDAAVGSADLVSYAWHVDASPLRIPKHIPIRQKGMRLTVTVVDSNSGTRSVITVPLGKQREIAGNRPAR